MAPPFRADQIGSLLRPAELLDARASLASPSQMYEVSQDEKLKEAERKAIEWVAQKQVELDIRPTCSGEYNRHIVRPS
jgi:methionine synthase II (cobalamin-independent)